MFWASGFVWRVSHHPPDANLALTQITKSHAECLFNPAEPQIHIDNDAFSGALRIRMIREISLQWSKWSVKKIYGNSLESRSANSISDFGLMSQHQWCGRTRGGLRFQHTLRGDRLNIVASGEKAPAHLTTAFSRRAMLSLVSMRLISNWVGSIRACLSRLWEFRDVCETLWARLIWLTRLSMQINFVLWPIINTHWQWCI